MTFEELVNDITTTLEKVFLNARVWETCLLLAFLLLLRWIVQRVLDRQIVDSAIRYRWGKTIHYITDALGVFFLLSIWFGSGHSLATYLGLLSAGLAIALQDLIANFAAWAYIFYKKPFDVGDRIEINGHRGDVVDIHFLEFTILEIGNWVQADQSTGRFIYIPNRRVLVEPLGNATQGWPFLWQETSIVVTFESDWQRCKVLLLEILENHVMDVVKSAEEYRATHRPNILVKHGTLTPIVYTDIDKSGVKLTMRFLCPPRRRRGLTQIVVEEFLRQPFLWGQLWATYMQKR